MTEQNDSKKVLVGFVYGIICLMVLATLLPWASASEPCILGYKALCSFSPVSTVILLFVGSMFHGKVKKKQSA